MATFYKRQSALSLEFVQAEVRAEKDGVSYDPTGDAVKMAFPKIGVDPSVWNPGQWETETSGPLATYLASCLVGPGGTVTLSKGKYEVWVWIVDSPEVPVFSVGILEVT